MERITFEELMNKYDVKTEGIILPADIDKIIPASISRWFRSVHRYYSDSYKSKSHLNATRIIAEIDVFENDEQHMINHLQFGFIRTFQTNSNTRVTFDNKEDALWEFVAFQYIRCKMYDFWHEDPFGKTTIKLSQCNLNFYFLSCILADLDDPKFIVSNLMQKWTKEYNLKSNYRQSTLELCQRTIDKMPGL